LDYRKLYETRISRVFEAEEVLRARKRATMGVDGEERLKKEE
jgi:hypothetical protein